MKVLVDCQHPFSLAHGGMQLQIERTLAALNAAGISAEPLRWWDAGQHGDLVHHFGPMPDEIIELTHRRGVKVVLTLLLSETVNRTPRQLALRRLLIAGLRRLPNWQGLGRNSVWTSCREADHVIVGLEAERRIVLENYGVPPAKVSTVPLGVTEAFLRAAPSPRTGDHLITVGTIRSVKRTLELAQLARKAEVPVLFVGQPDETDAACWREFSKLIDGRYVRHQPHVSTESELIQLYQAARGFVLMSQYENWSFVAHEAAACGLPLLLADLPWSRERFGGSASFLPKKLNETANAAALKSFYENAPKLLVPQVTLPGWQSVAQRLKQIYERLSPAARASG